MPGMSTRQVVKGDDDTSAMKEGTNNELAGDVLTMPSDKYPTRNITTNDQGSAPMFYM